MALPGISQWGFEKIEFKQFYLGTKIKLWSRNFWSVKEGE